MQKVSETVAEVFGMVQELILDEGSAANTEESDGQAGPLCELEEELH